MPETPSQGRLAQSLPNLENLATSVDINAEFLDELVVEHFRLKGVGLPVGEQVRRAVASGDILKAQWLAEQACPAIFQDLRLLFKLKQQQFIEVLRKGTPESKAAALEFLQKELTPLAMRSSCEGYTELKQSLLALVIQNQQQQPRIAAWDPAARDSLAACLARTVRQQMGEHDSRLSMLLCYLSLTTASCCKAIKPPPAPHLELLVSEDTPVDTPPIAPEACTLSAGVQVAMQNITPSQHLRMRSTFSLSATQATDSLRLAGGRLDVAVKNELTSISLSEPLFTNLLKEFAASRGLFSSCQGIAGATAAPLDATNGTAVLPAMHKGASKSAQQPCRDSSRSPPLKLARRSPEAGDASLGGPHQAAGSSAAQWVATDFLDLREHCDAGRHEEAIGMLEDLAPGFLESSPAAMFEVQAARCQSAMASGRHTEALGLVHHTLTPLCTSHPFLQHRLKSVMASLVIPKGGAAANPGTPALFTVLEEQLREWLGYEEPSLVKVIKVMLAAQKTWFELQQTTDCFEEMLGIAELAKAPCKVDNEPREAVAPSAAAAEPAGEKVERGDTLMLTEDLITDTMEITNLGRPQVLELLRDFQGDQALLLESFFQ